MLCAKLCVCCARVGGEGRGRGNRFFYHFPFFFYLPPLIPVFLSPPMTLDFFLGGYFILFFFCLGILDKEPWYKRGQVQERLPSFTDRILVHSIKDMTGLLRPEVNLEEPDSHNYGTFTSDLTGSDHSPIYCAFKLSLERSVPLRPSQMGVCYVASLCLVRVLNGFSNDERVPKYIRVLFPAPFEVKKKTETNSY